MPIDIKLDETHDIELVDGDLILINDIESFAQGLRIRLRFFAGEWFRDQRAGIIDPDGTSDLDLVNARIRKEISLEDGYVSMRSYSYDFSASTRTMTVNFEVETIWGNITVDEEVVV